MIKQEKARPEVTDVWDYLKPSLMNLTKFIAQKDKEINQGEEDRRKFSKLVNIKRGLS